MQAVIAGLGLFGLVSFIGFSQGGLPDVELRAIAGRTSAIVRLILLGNGPGNSGVKVNLGPVQPVEAIRLLLALFLSRLFRATLGTAQADSGGLGLSCWTPVLGCRVCRVARFLFPAKGSRSGAFYFMCLSRGLRHRQKSRGHGSGRARASRSWFLPWLCAECFGDVVGSSQMWMAPWDNTVRGGDQIAQSFWGFSDRRSLGHRSWSGRYAISAGRSHGSRSCSYWRRTRLHRTLPDRRGVRGDCRARIPRCRGRRTITVSFSRRR